MDDLERARARLRAAEADFERSVRWLAWSAVLVALSFGNLLAQYLHWLPPWVSVPLAALIGLAALLLLVPVLRWVWANRPWPRRRT